MCCVDCIRGGETSCSLVWLNKCGAGGTHLEEVILGIVFGNALGGVEGGVGAGDRGESQQHHAGEHAGGAKMHRERLCV